jgi:DAPG hydrolase PhiG domain
MTTHRTLQEGYHKTEDGNWEIIANHELHGVTPEMIDWWWDHMGPYGALQNVASDRSRLV